MKVIICSLHQVCPVKIPVEFCPKQPNDKDKSTEAGVRPPFEQRNY